MNTKAITIRTETDTIARIDKLAKAMDRSRNYVVNQAMLSYVAKSEAGSAPRPAPPAVAPQVEAAPPRKVKLETKTAAKSPTKKKGQKKSKKKKNKAGKKAKK